MVALPDKGGHADYDGDKTHPKLVLVFDIVARCSSREDRERPKVRRTNLPATRASDTEKKKRRRERPFAVMKALVRIYLSHLSAKNADTTATIPAMQANSTSGMRQ